MISKTLLCTNHPGMQGHVRRGEEGMPREYRFRAFARAMGPKATASCRVVAKAKCSRVNCHPEHILGAAPRRDISADWLLNAEGHWRR